MEVAGKRRLSTGAVLWLITAALMLFAIVPTLRQYAVVGHDVIYHSSRIINIATEMQNGNPFPLVYTYALNGLGYGAPLFYCDWFLYPFAALNAMGLSIYSTFKLLQVVLLLANFLSIYLVAKAIFRDRVQAQVTAIAYTFSFYAMLDIYYRAAIGECFAFIFLPVVYLGYYRITHGREDQWWLMALGMTAIALSHTLSIILGVIFLLVMMLFDIKFWIRNFAKIRYLAYAAALCIGLACFFWLPMLEQLTQLPFRLSLDVGNEQDRFTSQMYNPLRLLSSPLITAIVKPDEVLPQPRLTSLFGYAAMAIALFAVWRRGKGNRQPVRMLAAMFVFVWLSGRYSITQLLADTPLAALQFPWRILLNAVLVMALFFGGSWPSIKPGFWRGAAAGALALCAVASIWVNYPSVQYEYMTEHAAENGYSFEDFNDLQMTCNEISDGQYLPYDLDYEVDGSVHAFYTPTFDAKASDEAVQFSLSRDEHNRIVVEFSGNESGATIDLPLILYIGYSAEMDDGTALEVSRGESGMVRVSLGDAESGTFTVWYEGTALQTVGRVVSALSAVAFAVILVFQSRKRRAAAKA